MRSLIAVCLTVFLLQPSYAATIQVPADYPTVLQALDVAVAGDVVELAPGEYTDFQTRSVTGPRMICASTQNPCAWR